MMTETLIIRLGSQQHERIHWLISSLADNKTIASGELNNAQELEQLSEKANDRKVTVLVPASDVRLKKLNVPGKAQRAIKLAAPYMLEDELAQDVEQLFFAYHNIKDDESSANCFIAAVERDLMQEWLAWLSAANIDCQRILPDALAMPLIAGKKTAIQLGEQILLREEQWQASTIDLTLWPVISGQWQEETVIANFSALTSDNEHLVFSPQPEELPLALLAENINKQSFNLLQGEFKIEESFAPFLNFWKIPFALLCLVFVFVVASKGYQLTKLNEQQSSLEQQILQHYKKAFPETKRVKISTVRSLLRSKLKATGGQIGNERFITLFNKLSPAFQAVNSIKPEGLKFDAKRGEFRLQLTANSYADFEKFKNLLEKERLVVNLGSQNNQGGKIVGSFSIKEG